MFCAAMVYPKSPAGSGGIGGADAAEGLHPGLLFDNAQDYVFWAFRLGASSIRRRPIYVTATATLCGRSSWE